MAADQDQTSSEQKAVGRRPTGVIPANWAVPAEVSASAVGRPDKSSLPTPVSSPWPKVALVAVLLVAGGGAAVLSGAIPMSAFDGLVDKQPDTPIPENATVVARRDSKPSNTADPAADGDPEPADLAVEPLIPTVDNPALVEPVEPDPPEEPEPAEPAEPAEPQVELNELPVRKKAKSLVSRAERMVRKGRYRSAVKRLKQARNLDPSFAPTHRTLGIALARSGDYEGARKSYERYLELAPDAPDAADVRRILGQ